MTRLTRIGRKFGRLTVEAAEPMETLDRRYTCRCECGTVRSFSWKNLTSGRTKSCGCLQRDKMAEAALRRAQKTRGHDPFGAA